MPELPEVETVRIGLSRFIVSKRVQSVSHDWPKGFPNTPADVKMFLVGSTIIAVRRRAKVLLVDLSSEYTLVIHLKMTGQLVYRGEQAFGAGHPNDSLVGELPDKSTRVIVTFDDGSHLYFNDQRKFGWIRMVPTTLLNTALTGSVPESNARKQGSAQRAVQTVQRLSTAADDEVVGQELLQLSKLGLIAGESGTDAVIDFMKRLGPEPLEDDLVHTDFVQRVRRRNGTTIKAALLDQTVIAGIGNIYADEALWGAKIHPASRVRDIDDADLKVLFDEVRYVLALSIEKGGSTDKNYVNAEGKRGSYMDFARVFRREGLPCPRHPDVAVEKSRVAGRGTHTCPVCQGTIERT